MAKKKTRTLPTGKVIEFLKDEALSRRMWKLADEANREHRLASDAWRGALEHARNAGEALLELKARAGHRKKWGDWVRKNFRASPETARVYMRIARQWNDPRVEDARARGITINSIQAFLNVIRNKKEKPVDKIKAGRSGDLTKEDEKELTADGRRQMLRAGFGDYLKQLDEHELGVLAGLFEARLLPAMHRELKDWVCAVLEEDYYGEGDANKAWRRRATEAVKARRKGWRRRATDAVKKKRKPA